MVILLSIYKVFSEQIFNGTKTIEIRKTMPRDVEYPLICLLYEAKKGGGSGKVVGCFICNRIEKTNVFSCYEKYDFSNEAKRAQISKMSALSIDDIFGYAKHTKNIYLYYIDKRMKFKKPVSLKRCGLDYPPVSWRKLKIKGVK